MTTRRDFLDRLVIGGLGAGGVALGLAAFPEALAAESPPGQGSEWDQSWLARLNGRVRAVFDVPEIDRGYGVWRASVWSRQFEALRGIPAAQLSTALVLRHNAIVLAMTQEFWDRYGLASPRVEHPLTGAVIARNPALLGAADGLEEPYASFALPQFIARGNPVLACDAALRLQLVPLVMAKDGVPADEARTRAIAGLVQGVILQPSGIFAALVAQQDRQALYISSAS